jgi:hypothetical protein
LNVKFTTAIRVGSRVKFEERLGTVIDCYPDRLCLVEFDDDGILILHEDSLTGIEASP